MKTSLVRIPEDCVRLVRPLAKKEKRTVGHQFAALVDEAITARNERIAKAEGREGR